MLKYSAAFLAIAYALGFLEQSSFAATVGVGEFRVRLADTNYLIRGLLVEAFCIGASVANILFLEFASHVFVLLFGRPAPDWIQRQAAFHDRKYRLGLVLGQVAVSLSAVLIVGRFLLRLSLGWSVSLAVSCGIVNLVVSLILVQPEVYFSSTVRQQLSLLMLVALGLTVFSLGLGIADGSELLQKPGRSVRLLIAPDAIDGLKHLGIAFPDSSCGTTSAEPTESIHVLYQGESMYVVRTKNNSVVQIKSDKVWSVEPSP
ncbi:MAG: hypothetical protein LAO24_07455 [Acidobacteriia bacterium]|nr:hypothetical protein [Terriglobia bacterium]